MATSKLRLAMIGCGQVAEFHAQAFRAAGFDLACLCGRPGSQRASDFASRHEIQRVFRDVDELLEERSGWDALLIAVTPDATLDILKKAIQLDVPVLVEKPGGKSAADLESLVGPNVTVGYNRRFYGTVQAAREEEAAHAPLLATMMLPESIRTPERQDDDPAYLEGLFNNSVHGFDMLRFVFGELEIDSVHRLTNDSGALYGFAALVRSQSGTAVQLTANWQTPANFTLTLDRPGHRLMLWPFEEGYVYEGMEAVPATPEVPIRRYRPELVRTVSEIKGQDPGFKAGFVAQAGSLAAVARGESPGVAATLKDAHAALQLAERLLGRTLSGDG